MSDASTDFDAIRERLLEEFRAQGFGNAEVSFKEAMELRSYAKARTDLRSEELTPEQAIWKSLYESLTEELRNSFPDSMKQIEQVEQERDDLEGLKAMMLAKLQARPNDYGARVWWGFVIIGILVGWLRSRDIVTILVYVIAFWITGLFFCVFAIDSAEIQSKIAIFLNRRLHMKGLANWLYKRALTIR